MERCVLFKDDIAKVFLENIEQVCQPIRQTGLINPQPATVAASQPHRTTITFNNTTTVPIKHHPTTTNHLRSTVDDKNDIDEVPLERSRRNEQRRTTSHTNHKTSHSNVRSNHSSHRYSHRTTSSHRVNNKDYTDTDSSASGNLGATTEEERQRSRSNPHSTSELSFFRRTKVAKNPGLESLVTPY